MSKSFLSKLGHHSLLFGPALFALATAVFFQTHNYYLITGDEPHYLLITESILSDGDVWLTNNQQAANLVTQAVPYSLANMHSINGASLHGRGLGLLLIVPYALGGIWGSKMALAFGLTALFTHLCYHMARQICGSARWALVAAVTFTFGLPFLAGSSQIYPDLLAGWLILHAVWLLYPDENGKRPLSPPTILLFSLETAFLPWLHVRLLAPALILALFFMATCWDASRKRPQLQPLLPFLLLNTFSLALLASYNLRAFGHALGPYTPEDLLGGVRQMSMVWGGLLWDAQHGLLLQHPFVWLSLLGVGTLGAHHKRETLLLVLLYLALTVPNAMHWNVYGGFSFWGRFGWAAVGLWFLPLAHTFALLAQRPWGRPFLLLASAASLALQTLFAHTWVTHNNYLYNYRLGTQPIWARENLYRHWFAFDIAQLQRLPSFADVAQFTSHYPNWVALLLSLALVGAGSGVLWHGRWRKPDAIWGLMGLAAVGLLLLPPRPIQPIILPAHELPSQTGQIIGQTRIASTGESGLLTHGPYIPLVPNTPYHLKLAYQHRATSPSAKWRIVFDTVIVWEEDFLPFTPSLQPLVWEHTFQIPALHEINYREEPVFQLYIQYDGEGELIVEQLEVIPLIQ